MVMWSQEVPGMLVHQVGDCLSVVDGRASANGDDRVDAAILLQQLFSFVQLLHWRMLSDLAECARVLVSQQLFHLLDQGRLRRERVSGDDECRAGVFR